MEDIRVTVTGSEQEMDELETFCRKQGVMTERGLISAYDGVAVSVFALHAIARFEVLAQCIAAYGALRATRLRVSYVVPGKGRLTVTDYGFKAVAEVLRQTQELSFDRDGQGVQA
jgi:hypothetical protein